jgi:hypothetical protein
MRDFHVSDVINASLARVWSVLADIERWPEWNASVARVEPLTGVPLASGSRVRIVQPKIPPAVWEVTVWAPERRFTWRTARPGVMLTGDHQLDSSGDGCRATLTLHFGGILGGLAGRLTWRLTADYITLEARGLKARAETAT